MTNILTPIQRLDVNAYRIPTATPEADGTISWDSTTMVVVEAHAGKQVGLGYSYTSRGAVEVIRDVLLPQVEGEDPLDIPRHWMAMLRSIRNLGPAGVASMAASAVDAALWDLKARVLGLSLAKLLGVVREAVPLYGSGGFTSYALKELEQHCAWWREQGYSRIKMKVGQDPSEDLARVCAVRRVIGKDAELFVDANGAYSRSQAQYFAAAFHEEAQVSWFEEPVSSEDLEGLRLVRDRAPPGLAIAAGEYGHSSAYFRQMLAAGAVDVLQADATRCVGISGFLEAASLARGFCLPLSAHCAPSMHVHAAASLPGLAHVECFFDHLRVEQMLFDGVPAIRNGDAYPDLDARGNGLSLRRADASRYLM